MKSCFQPAMQDIPFEPRQTRHERRWVIILIGLVFVTGLVFYVSGFSTVTPHSADTTKSLSEAMINLQTMYKSLHMLHNGDEGYIAVEDIQSHPLLNVYIDPNVLVSRVPEADRIVHLTIVDDVIVLDPISVQQALRYVAIGPDPNSKTVLLSSTAWLQKPDTHEHSSDDRSVTLQNGRD